MNETSEKPAAFAASGATLYVREPAVGVRIVIPRGLSLEYVGDMEDGAEMWEVASDAEAEETV